MNFPLLSLYRLENGDRVRRGQNFNMKEEASGFCSRAIHIWCLQIFGIFWSPPVRIWDWSTVLNSRNLPYYIFFWDNPPPPSVRTSYMDAPYSWPRTRRGQRKLIMSAICSVCNSGDDVKVQKVIGVPRITSREFKRIPSPQPGLSADKHEQSVTYLKTWNLDWSGQKCTVKCQLERGRERSERIL